MSQLLWDIYRVKPPFGRFQGTVVAIVDVILTKGALASTDRSRLSTELAAATYEAEGFAGSTIAPGLCWTLFEERPPDTFLTGAGEPAAALFYVRVTALQGAISSTAKRELGRRITDILLTAEGRSPPHDATRVWVQFVEIRDGDLIVGGESTSLESLRALVGTAS